MSHPHYKLTYFPTRGAAESIRYIFAYAGVPYEDIRISQDEWKTLKAKTLFRQVPFLEMDGKTYGQSVAIARMLAKKYNLAGKDIEEQAHVDAVVDFLKDISAAVRKIAVEKDPEQQAKLREEYYKTQGPDQLDVLQNQLHGDYFARSGVTFADFAVATFLFGALKRVPSVLDHHQKLKALMDRVHNLPGIKEWIATRPVTEN